MAYSTIYIKNLLRSPSTVNSNRTKDITVIFIHRRDATTNHFRHNARNICGVI